MPWAQLPSRLAAGDSPLLRLWQSLFPRRGRPEPSPGGYRLRRSARAKRARIAVYPDRIEVVVPSAMPPASVEAFIAGHWQWATNKLAELAGRAAIAIRQPACDTHMLYQGTHYPLAITEQAKLRGSRVVFDPHFQPDALVDPLHGRFVIGIPAGLDTAARRQWLKTRQEAWYRRQVAGEVQRVIQQHAGRHGLHPRRIAVRDQKTRWGSCGPRGDININWRLILAPPAALEYVVVHELCHLRHRNHAQPFWALVEDHLPHYREQRRWLKDNGHTLMAVLVD
ncbi:MAG: M48 family peptidase [Methylococcaceae bacterium]|nr:MAG: M48 family peptidase [Methylococcaceae bacterium]